MSDKQKGCDECYSRHLPEDCPTTNLRSLRTALSESEARVAGFTAALEETIKFIRPRADDSWAWIEQPLKDSLPILQRVRAEARAGAFEEAALEAEKPRIMLLTKESIEDGILSDEHPVIKARAQMRKEIAKALRIKAAEGEG